MAGLQKILIVEDNPALRALYKDFLESSGFSVHEAINGQQGLVEAQAFQPDLIFLDVMTPVMNGFQAALSLRNNPTYNSTSAKIILLSNLALDKIPPDVDAAIDGHALKVDISLTDLVDMIHSFD